MIQSPSSGHPLWCRQMQWTPKHSEDPSCHWDRIWLHQQDWNTIGAESTAASRKDYLCKSQQVSQIKDAINNAVQMITSDREVQLIKVARAHPKAKLVLRTATDDFKAVCCLSVKFGATLKTSRVLFCGKRAIYWYHRCQLPCGKWLYRDPRAHHLWYWLCLCHGSWGGFQHGICLISKVAFLDLKT